MTHRLLMRVLPIIAAAAATTGLVITVFASRQPATFGWFGYSPLSAGDRLDGLHFVSTTGVVGVIVLGVGLIALAFWAGLRLGTHRPRPRTRR